MTLKITVVENADDEHTKLSTEDIHFRAPGTSLVDTPMRLSEHTVCERYLFVELPKGYNSAHDFASRKSLCVILSGQLEVKTSDGQARVMTAGDTLALRDMDFESPSRELSVLSEDPVRALVIQID